MKREALVGASKVARSLKSLEEIDGTINYVLLNYIYETGDANEFKTFAEWKVGGYGVRKGEKAFIAWGKPRERVTKGGNTYSGAYPFTFRQPIKHKIAFKSTILYPFIP